MPANRRTTLKDLARELGVSTATISNAFNRPDQLSPALRERILGTAKRLGYGGPDAKARSLRTGRSRIIAVILAESLTYSLNDAVASEFLSGVAEVLDNRGHTLLLLSSRQTQAQIPGSASMADGFIVYGLIPSLALLESLPSQSPLVSVDFDIAGRPTVHVDNEAACHAIAAHALRTPAKRPGIINLRLTATPLNGRISSDHRLLPPERTITRSRLSGFHRALGEAGVDTEQVPMWNIEENTFEVCAPVISEILDLPASERPDLLLCMSDRIALTVVTMAEQRGLRIPEDLRITGFDGIAEGQYRAPRLTTVRQNSVEKGRIAARIILGLAPAEPSLLATELLIADSCP
ncbi:LacI family DNA-binding transcriptional regulator [Halomonas urumqiensis]|uniref:LacI family transcriptional regulator n=1 Tax=Halomonas urumqiensis TaxID=1684789 RepID=A0A2N7UHF5_9GAMM|nr:LacI family DNA-binding transcriptional regulator [Halomonas urumqiensis]PMR79864.1 LacI family transcriptional regulator [Halomonas urumqiensis]PTB02110.1 LacI family DNA-binding transcriptional regulator [Halomonas urumqiensis]GHE21558.1 LacI family transcriptional regulator [Halomonas urumqiensis]